MLVCFFLFFFSSSLCRQYQTQRENQELFGTRTTLRKLESLIRLSKGEEMVLHAYKVESTRWTSVLSPLNTLVMVVCQ